MKANKTLFWSLLGFLSNFKNTRYEKVLFILTIIVALFMVQSQWFTWSSSISTSTLITRQQDTASSDKKFDSLLINLNSLRFKLGSAVGWILSLIVELDLDIFWHKNFLTLSVII